MLLRVHSLVWFLALLLIFSCKKADEVNTTPIRKEVPFSETTQVFITFPNTPLGLMMHDPNIDKDIYYFGNKGPDGILSNITLIMVADRESQEWVLYELNEDYLPVHIRLSKGYTIEYSDYDLNRRTVTIKGYQTDSRTQLGVVENVPFDQNALDWATQAKQMLQRDLRNARTTADCNNAKYRAAVAGYFAANAVGCYLGVMEFATGAGIPLAILSAYNTYQNCKSALGVLQNLANGQAALDCPGAQDFANNNLACLEGELNAFSGNPYNFVQSCASGYLANAAAAARCLCDKDEDLPSGRSTGDPHLRTMDQLLYDFMAVGEFVALTSTTDNFEIQARQQDVNTTGSASMNTGVAVRMGSDVVCVLVNPSRLYINGTLTENNFAQLTLNNGNTLTKAGNDLVFSNGQGDQVTIRWLNDYYLLDYLVTLNPVRAGKVQGLLGNYDGDPRNDLVIRNGQAINGTFAELYPVFADSWRIEQTKSLFVYEAGKNTESYTDRNFPRIRANLTEAQRQWAAGVCRQAGITDPEYLQDCIYDVAITGDERLASSSAWAEKADAIIPAADLPATSDLQQFTGVRLEIAADAADPDQVNLLDFDTGTTFKMKDGAANASRIDAIGYQYCSTVLAIPSTIRYCGFSCGSGRVWEAVKSDWAVFNTGTIRYSHTQDTTTNIPVQQWNNIQSAGTIKALLAPLRLVSDEYFPFGATDIESSNNLCTPQYLQNKSLYGFMTQNGKMGVYRITANGITPENRRWYTLDIKIER